MKVKKEIDCFKGKDMERDVFEVGKNDLVIDGKVVRIARLKDEFANDLIDPEGTAAELVKSGCPADILMFWDRIPREDRNFPCHVFRQAQSLLPVSTYEEWWHHQISKQTRKSINRGIKWGVEIRIENFSEEVLVGIKEIFDETAIRRGKKCWHYQKSLDELRTQLGRDLDVSEFILAFYEGKIIGFIKLVFHDKFADPALFMSKTSHFHLKPNNVLLAKCVERCAARSLPYLHYADWRIKSHAEFLSHHGFQKIAVNRYYLPLNLRGKLILSLGAHQSPWSRVPEQAKIGILKLREFWLKNIAKAS